MSKRSRWQISLRVQLVLVLVIAFCVTLWAPVRPSVSVTTEEIDLDAGTATVVVHDTSLLGRWMSTSSDGLPLFVTTHTADGQQYPHFVADEDWHWKRIPEDGAVLPVKYYPGSSQVTVSFSVSDWKRMKSKNVEFLVYKDAPKPAARISGDANQHE